MKRNASVKSACAELLLTKEFNS